MREPHRRALLLTGAPGAGGDASAAACTASLGAHGWATRTLDVMRLAGLGRGSAGALVTRSMRAVPGLYDAIHFAGLRSGSKLALAAEAFARYRLIPRLRDYLDKNPAELIVSVHSVAASAMSALRAKAGRAAAVSHVVYCTDATPHRIWVQPQVDLYLLTSFAAEQAVLRFDPRARVAVIPAAVRPGFYRPPARQVARVGLGIGAQDRSVLLMADCRDSASLADIAESLGRAGLHVLAVAGHHLRLERRLRAVAAREPRVRVFGVTDRVPELMAAADLVITSAGVTCSEARTVGRPLLLLDTVQGHGRDNLQHELELGLAAVSSCRPDEVVRSAQAFLGRLTPVPPGPTRFLADWERAFGDALATIGALPAVPVSLLWIASS